MEIAAFHSIQYPCSIPSSRGKGHCILRDNYVENNLSSSDCGFILLSIVIAT